jgi:hypothetical protein
MSQTSNQTEAGLPYGLAEAIFDSHDWLLGAADPDASLGHAYVSMISMADRLMLGEETDAARAYTVVIAALAEVEDRWPLICSDDGGCRVLSGFIWRSHPIELLAERWAEDQAS